MKQGDRVKLSQRGVKAVLKARGGTKYPLARRGVIVSTINHYAVAVLWDGRRSLDRIPVAAVELERPVAP